jgi:multiple sugar transport system permease protein
MPSIVYILALVGIPFILAIGLAFSDVTAGDPSFDWVGLENFRLVFEDPVFWRSLGNTFIFTGVSMVLIVVLGKVLANILVADFRGKWVVRFLVLLPWTTPVALSAAAWLWLLDSVFSPIDWVLRELGLIGHEGALLGANSNLYYLGEPGLSMASVIAVTCQRITPLAAVIVMIWWRSARHGGGRQVDGAGYWRRMFEMTVPLVAPVTASGALFRAIFTFTDAGGRGRVTNGGPNMPPGADQVRFFRGIDGGDVGQGAAIALFLFPILLAAAIAILRVVRKVEVS